VELDARTLPDGQVLESDLCIVGAGPAGLVLGRALMGRGVRVTLVESGGFEPDPDVQALSGGVTVGDPYGDLRLTRHRQVGGTVHVWNTPVGAEIGAKYVPLDTIDLETRSWVPLSGWPFDRPHLDPFYRRAHAVCGLGDVEYEGERWTDADHPALPLAADAALTTGVYQFGVGRPFTQTYPGEVRQASNVLVVHHATVRDLETDRAAERVLAARAACLTGTRVHVRARRFVLAAGAIENARLLLLSRAVRPEGLGNRHGWVGRCFMEHPRDYALRLVPRRPDLYDRAVFYDAHPARTAVIMGRLALREERLRSERLLNASATLLPIAPRPSWLGATLAAVGDPLRLWRMARPRRERRRDYPRGGAGWSLEPDKARSFVGFRLLVNLEQAPHPDNRVVLARQCDALGLPRAEVHWRWRDADQRNLERVRAILVRELEAAGLGRVEVAAGGAPDPNAHHHAGTTRMHQDPRAGVVDERGRVHDLENLYVAGSSVYPTAGFANPTLTVVALALRLADHLAPAP
jgi:choline dehydrogenase-like flavoprotein